jgi:ferredoxin/flavodoxin---NADP+ reductase
LTELKEDIGSGSVFRNDHVVTGIRGLTESTFVLGFTRSGKKFRSGQRIIVGLKGELDQREYSIYSGESDETLEILIREVKGGNVSAKLKQSKPGDLLDVNGPFGSFGIEPFNLYTAKHIFVATGTGISPFHSLVRSYPGIDYTLIHGVSFCKEAYGSEEYEQGRYILCTSQEHFEGRRGRVTDYLLKFNVTKNMIFYLCGNSGMIYEAGHILKEKGIISRNINSEIYF